MTGRAPRILYLLSHPIQYQSPMLRYLADSGRVDVHTVYARQGGTTGYFDEGFGQKVIWDVPLTQGYSYEFLPSWFGDAAPGRFTPWSRDLGAVLRRFKPDSIWVHGYDQINAVQLMARAKLAGIPVMARADVEESDAHGGPAVRMIKNRILRQGYKSIDGFLAIGVRNRQFYLDRGVSPSRIFPVPYAVDNLRFKEAKVVASTGPTLADEYDLPAGSTVFLFSGKLIARKRPFDCILALAELVTVYGLNVSLVFVGSGELSATAQKLAADHGVTDRVRFAGFMNQQEIASCYARAGALLLTSERERWGLVANEAMAAGCPVISYHAVGCSDDLVLDDVSGHVVSTGDTHQLAAAMARLCDPTTRDRLAGGATKRVADFSFEAIENGLIGALTAVAR